MVRSGVTTGERPVLPKAKEIEGTLRDAGVRVTLDERDERPGWKFSEWELRGVPLGLK